MEIVCKLKKKYEYNYRLMGGCAVVFPFREFRQCYAGMVAKSETTTARVSGRQAGRLTPCSRRQD